MADSTTAQDAINEEKRRRWFAAQLFGRSVDSPTEAVRHLVAIQTQYCQSLPTSLAVRGFAARDAWVAEALKPGGPIMKTWSVRGTLHTLCPEVDGIIRRVTGEHSLARYRRNLERYWGKNLKQQLAIESRIVELLRDGPKTRREIHAAIPEFQTLGGTGWGMDVYGLATQGRLAISSHMGTTIFYAKEPHVVALSKAEAAGEVLFRYLKAFGCATRKDFAYWSGFKTPEVQFAIDELNRRGELTTLKSDPSTYVLRNAISDLEPPKIALSAKFDSMVLGHHDKSFYLPESLRYRVSRKAGHVEGCVFKFGQVAGTWRLKRTSNGLSVTVEVWENLKSADHRLINRALESMASNLGLALVRVEFESPSV